MQARFLDPDRLPQYCSGWACPSLPDPITPMPVSYTSLPLSSSENAFSLWVVRLRRMTLRAYGGKPHRRELRGTVRVRSGDGDRKGQYRSNKKRNGNG